MIDFDILLNPGKHGMEPCRKCNGYGSCLSEAGDKCSRCGGSGLVKKDSQGCARRSSGRRARQER